jgi:hypothetical protein
MVEEVDSGELVKGLLRQEEQPNNSTNVGRYFEPWQQGGSRGSSSRFLKGRSHLVNISKGSNKFCQALEMSCTKGKSKNSHCDREVERAVALFCPLLTGSAL